MVLGKELVISILKKGDIVVGGRRSGDITVHDERFYSRVLAHASLGLGESYMDGWWDSTDLPVFFYKLFRNRVQAPRIDPDGLWILAKSLILNIQNRRGTQKIADTHYNLPSEFYMLFLGPHNQYSSYYYAHTKNDQLAEEARLDLICRKLGLNKNDHVLDIGSGWGGFARYAARRYGCHVTGISIAHEQVAYAKRFTKGLPVDISVLDYRDLRGKYTKIFSGGMFEHVGHKNYRTYLGIIHRSLTDDGLVLLDGIGSIKVSNGPDPWIHKYIFPNSMLPTPNHLTQAFEELFVLEDWHNFGYDYGLTLEIWRKRFIQNWKKIQKLDPLFTERFFRMWLYYLSAFEGTFKSRELQQWQIVLSKQGVPGGYTPVR